MTSRPSSTRIPAPSVLDIDRSKYPFCSPLFEPDATDGKGIQWQLENRMGWSERSELSYFEVVGGKGDLYEHLDVRDDTVTEFVYASLLDTQRSPEIRIFFIEIALENWDTTLSLTREAFIELLEKTGVPPIFIEVFISKAGALIGCPVYSEEDQEKVIAYQLLVRFSGIHSFNAAVYFRYDFLTGRTTCLFFGNHFNRIQKRFQQVFPGDISTGTGLPLQYHRDPFLVLSTISAEYASVMRVHCSTLVTMYMKHQDRAGVFAHLYDSLRVSPSALPSRIKGLHVCNRHLAYFMYTLEFHISWMAFLQRQHRIFNEFRTKLMIDGMDGNQIRRMKDESMASQKVLVSLELSASRLHNMLFDVRELSHDTQTAISFVQSIISQFDSRTNISIARDSKRIAFDAKKDSVAMKTIAGLTMVFLPGTFTATFFSMVFFHVTDDPEPRLTVNKHWWLYVAVTVPLTILVLAAWLGWLRWKRRGMPENAELEDAELEDLGEK